MQITPDSESSRPPRCTPPRPSLALALALAAGLAGCASAPAPAPAPTEPPKLAVLLDQADTARKAGDLAQAMTALDDAARHHPAAPEPWVRKAQIHFDQGSYAPAVMAAQEGLQRNATDDSALSIIAVSGLRIAAGSLSQLRRTSQIQGSTRAEAEALARTIREALGESTLVPGAARPSRLPATAGRRDAPAAATAEPAAPARPAAPVATMRAPTRPAAPASGGRNPLDILQ